MYNNVNFYTVSETQENNGQVSVIPVVYAGDENLNAAYAKYYTILAAASVSSIEYHAANIMRQDGLILENKVFDRRLPEPAPVPEEPEVENGGE